MKTRLLITAATSKELESVETSGFANSINIETLVTGVGSVSSVYSLMNHIRDKGKPDIIINIGIAGSFTSELKIGDAIVVESDCFADLGNEEKNGFTSAWESGLIDPSAFPFQKGRLYSDTGLINLLKNSFLTVRAITVNSASGKGETIDNLLRKYNPEIETMEVAAVLYVGAMEKIPLVALRSISNFVEPRNRDAWDILSALKALKPALNLIITKILRDES